MFCGDTLLVLQDGKVLETYLQECEYTELYSEKGARWEFYVMYILPQFLKNKQKNGAIRLDLRFSVRSVESRDCRERGSMEMLSGERGGQRGAQRLGPGTHAHSGKAALLYLSDGEWGVGRIPHKISNWQRVCHTSV